MAKIVQVLTRPSQEYDLGTAEAQVRDLDAIVEKLNTTFQEELKDDPGSGSTITITLVNASGAIFNLFKDKAIASKATTELLTQPLVMEESEVLKVQAADANELHVIASILEIQPREVTA
jgi:hypothetical protein